MTSTNSIAAPASRRRSGSPDARHTVMRPGYEGANIRTWIGFKHFMYLVEAATLDWFRAVGLGPQRLYHEYGLGLEIVDSSLQLPALLEADDVVDAELAPAGEPGAFTVRLRADRDGGAALVARGKVAVRLVREHGAPGTATPPAEVAEIVAEDAAAPGSEPRPIALAGAAVGDALLASAPGSFLWDWRARYFHCHFSDRVQHSAYTRALEEVVDRFLADRGISIRRLLDERGWIPVVSRARVTLLGDALMEETIHTRFTVHEVIKDRAFDATMTCHVRRGDDLVPVATASILHGYAASRGPEAGALVVLDDDVQAILTGGAR